MFEHIRSWRLVLILALIAVALPACADAGKQPAATVTPAPSGPQLFLEDDFEDSGSGWLEAADAESSQGYRGGRFFFELRAADLIVWDNPGSNLQDFVLEVEARQVSGDAENSYGVLVRYVDDGNFYRFDLTGDGYYAVTKLENQEWNTLQDWQASQHIKPQGELNRIKVVCQGLKMAFYANDQPLTTVEDSAFERGDVGLFASTFADPDVTVEFDNLAIWQVEQQ